MKKINTFTGTASIEYIERIRIEEDLLPLHVEPWNPIYFGKHPRTDISDVIRKKMHHSKWFEIETMLAALNAGEIHVALIGNLPTGLEKNNVPTPRDGKHSFLKNNVSESLILGLACMMGAYIRLAENETIPFNEGIHDVTPSRSAKPGANGNLEGVGSHVDRCFVPETDIPEFTGLFCLREQKEPVTCTSKNPKTGFITVPDFVRDIPERIYAGMFQSEFKDPNSDAVTSLLHGNAENHSSLIATLDLNPGWMEGTTQEARDALAWLQANEMLLRKNAFEIELKEGQAVLFNDLKVIHYRTQYEMNDDVPHLNRWLQRWHMRLNE